MVIFELWDLDSGNLMGSFSSESEALELLRNAIEAYGVSYVGSVALGRRDAEGKVESIAEGSALAGRVVSLKAPS